ncbi:GNAT family N-acetyltransferase [Buchananella felis]|uniref:GNAT family N-acetyltransferase n=1 Tax=Buchananella felis TaxID=3231492 RepID=UPI00352782C1
MTPRTDISSGYITVALGPRTWDVFAELIERNNGVFGGCWCIGYHPECGRIPRAAQRQAKHHRVLNGEAHAALVLDAEGSCQAWAQYGPPDELAGIKHRRAYDKQPPPLPDWRLACVYVDPKHRGQGLATAAILGAVELIAQAGGGVVEAISDTTAGRNAQSRFLFTATVELLEDLGFKRIRQVGKHAWILTMLVPPRT